VLADETIISNSQVLNPTHFIAELISSFKSDKELFNILEMDLVRSQVKIHVFNNATGDYLSDQIYNLQQFTNILSKYDGIMFRSNKSGCNLLKNLKLIKLILSFCNQISQVPLIEYSSILFTGNNLFNSADAIVNYDILMNPHKIVLQSSISKKVVSDTNNITFEVPPARNKWVQLRDSEIILSTIVSLNIKNNYFFIDIIKLVNYNINI